MRNSLSDILIDGDKPQAFHIYRDSHKRRFTLSFCFADGSRLVLPYRHLTSVKYDGDGVINIKFVAEEIELTGSDIGSLFDAISRGDVCRIFERSSDQLESNDSAAYVRTIRTTSMS